MRWMVRKDEPGLTCVGAIGTSDALVATISDLLVSASWAGDRHSHLDEEGCNDDDGCTEEHLGGYRR